MGTLAEDLRARGFLIRSFDSAAAFAQALPITVSDEIVEGRLFAICTADQAEIFVLEYSARKESSTYDHPVRRLVHVRHPALSGTALVSPTLFRSLFKKGGWLGTALLLLLLALLAIPLLLLFLLTLPFKGDQRGRVRFGGAFDRQFKVISRDEASARALLGDRLRSALLASDLVESLSFDDGLTVNAVGTDDTLALVDRLPALVGVALPSTPYR